MIFVEHKILLNDDEIAVRFKEHGWGKKPRIYSKRQWCCLIDGNYVRTKAGDILAFETRLAAEKHAVCIVLTERSENY